MALWAKVQQLTGEAMRQMQNAYGAHFPIEVRHFFAQWIEEQPWDKIDEDSPDHEQYAIQLRDSLLKMLEGKANELGSDDMFLTKLKLQETVNQFRDIYENNPMNLVRVINNCLTTEKRLVQAAEGNVVPDSGDATAYRQIVQQFEMLQRCSQATEIDARQLQQKQESFILQFQQIRELSNQLEQLQNQPNGQQKMECEERLKMQKQNVETQLGSKAKELLHLRITLAEQYSETCEMLTRLQTHILDEQLINWKRQQQMAGNGATFEGGLETLQQWCESLAKLIWFNRQQIKRLEYLHVQLPIDLPPGQQDLLPGLNKTITGLLSSLVTSTFIIEKQPPQVLKKDSRFTATVRLLIGGKLDVHMRPPTVKSTIISEEQARSLLKNDKNVKDETSGDILNNTGQMEYHQANGQLAVTFRNMQLKRIRRAEKKGNETVTEEKFSILFQSQFSIGGGEFVFQVWTLSLPVVVTVHGNQECNALATILWDNAFAEPGRVPFQVPDIKVWPEVAKALHMKFDSATGRGLNADHLQYLASKLFGPSEDYSNHMVSWTQFNREPLPGRNFTFWEWFYAVLKLTKDWLPSWKDGLIHGFVDKILAQEMLLNKCNGTFLLRFSDSELGGVTFAWVADAPNKPGERLVWNLQPFTDKELRIRGLGDRIKDLDNLVYLYPDIPKPTAFSKYWTHSTESQISGGGYVKPDLTTVIPGLLNKPAAPLNFEDPRTPVAMQPQSPSTSVNDTYSVASPGETQRMETGGGAAAMDQDLMADFNMSMTDYVPENIDEINVNELLYSSKQSN